MDEKSALELALVHEFVGKAHGGLDAIQKLFAREPALINAAWDWGGGDWETALGAASPMGRRDIAEFLPDHGARIDLFAAAMLGKLDFVKEAIKAFPAAAHVAGPHGIPLIVHAEKGGEEAKAVLEFLNSL